MRILVVLIVAFAVGCSPAPQVMTGRIDPGFPSPITSVKVTTSSIQSWHGDALVTISPIAADGTFRVESPPLSRVRIQLIADNGRSVVVFPRQVGVVQSAFRIRPNGAPFDFGGIRYIGDASATPFVFRTPGSTTGDVDCDDDGRDANGAMCVDDSDDDHGTCDEGDDDDDEDADDNDDGEHEDGDDEDGEHADPDDGPDMGDAVADHNFPADGCSDDDDEGDDD